MLHSIFFIFSCCIFYTTAQSNQSDIEKNADLYGFKIDFENVPSDVEAQAKMNPEEMARHWGFGAETHKTTTEDGYTLQMYRIYNSSMPFNSSKVVYLQHGVFDSSYVWVVNSPNQSLAFILANLGYDVWLGNFRGSTYSREHIKYNPNEPGEFWCITLDDFALKDLPTMLDYVLNATNSKSINVVAHDGATSTILMLLSTNLEFNQNIKSAHLFGPDMDLNHSSSAVIATFAETEDTLDECTELFWNSDFQRKLSENTRDGNISAYQQIFGQSVNQLNETRIPIYVAQNPSGASAYVGKQFGQIARSGAFSRFDYGTSENLKKYNQTEPPLYQIENISTKISLYCSDSDALADPQDVDVLIGKLNSLESVYRLKTDEAVLNHQDFVWSYRAPELVYKHLIAELEKHDTSTSNN